MRRVYFLELSVWGEAETPSNHHKPNEIIAASWCSGGRSWSSKGSPTGRQPLSEVLGVGGKPRRERAPGTAWGKASGEEVALRGG